jgi:hypothetical protein
MEAFHHEQVLADGAMRLIDQGAGHRHQEVCEHGIPTCLFVLEPVSDGLIDRKRTKLP